MISFTVLCTTIYTDNYVDEILEARCGPKFKQIQGRGGGGGGLQLPEVLLLSCV